MKRNTVYNGFPAFIRLAWTDEIGEAFQDELEEYWSLFYAHDGFEVLIRAMINPTPSKRPDIHQVQKILLLLLSGSYNTADIADELGITQGMEPSKLGQYYVDELFSEDVCLIDDYIRNPLSFIYTLEDLESLRDGFLDVLPEDMSGVRVAAKNILGTITTLIAEKKGEIPEKCLDKDDFSKFNADRYQINIYNAAMLLGNREGTWTFCYSFSGDRSLLYIKDNKPQLFNFDEFIGEKNCTDITMMRYHLYRLKINPKKFVPKLLE